jgi:hypothetical protein
MMYVYNLFFFPSQDGNFSAKKENFSVKGVKTKIDEQQNKVALPPPGGRRYLMSAVSQ